MSKKRYKIRANTTNKETGRFKEKKEKSHTFYFYEFHYLRRNIILSSLHRDFLY